MGTEEERAAFQQRIAELEQQVAELVAERETERKRVAHIEDELESLKTIVRGHMVKCPGHSDDDPLP